MMCLSPLNDLAMLAPPTDMNRAETARKGSRPWRSLYLSRTLDTAPEDDQERSDSSNVPQVLQAIENNNDRDGCTHKVNGWRLVWRKLFDKMQDSRDLIQSRRLNFFSTI